MAWFAANLAWASAAMLLVLALRRPAARLFGAGVAYALWLVPALRLVMPPLPAEIVAAVASPSELAIVLDVPVAAASAASSTNVWPWLVGLWLAGAAAFLGWQWLAYRAFLTRLSLASRSLGSHRGLPLVESEAVQGPLALGLLDRRIVVPSDFSERYSPEQRRLALDHEAVHHRRGDIWWNLAALMVLALNWFNPVAWLAFRAFREDQEIACDAAVAARALDGDRHAYALALVKSASRPGLVAVCPLNHADQLKRRLKMMKHHRPNLPRSLAGAASVAALAAVALAMGSPGAAHPHPDGEGKERRIVIMEQKGDAREGSTRELRLRRGEDGTIVLPENCGEGERLADVDEQSGDRRTRIVLCSRGGGSPAERADRLQQARDRLAGDSAIAGEHRERVLAALDREIARLRGR